MRRQAEVDFYRETAPARFPLLGFAVYREYEDHHVDGKPTVSSLTVSVRAVSVVSTSADDSYDLVLAACPSFWEARHQADPPEITLFPRHDLTVIPEHRGKGMEAFVVAELAGWARENFPGYVSRGVAVSSVSSMDAEMIEYGYQALHLPTYDPAKRGASAMPIGRVLSGLPAQDGWREKLSAPQTLRPEDLEGAIQAHGAAVCRARDLVEAERATCVAQEIDSDDDPTPDPAPSSWLRGLFGRGR